MQHLEDVTPHQYRHAAVPNDTVDDLTGRNLLSLAVLTNFIRHADKYGLTLAKLRQMSGGAGESAISKAYNVCVEGGYMGRVEFTYEKPAGDTGRNGRRATYSYVSRVPLSEEQFAEVVRRYTPGRYVFTPIKTGTKDANGHEEHELRRVRVIAAEIYCHLGPMRIDRDGLLSEHTNARGGRSKAARARAEREASSPEPGNPGSGPTSTDETKPQVAPEPGPPESGGPGSIKKDQREDQEDQGSRLASLVEDGANPSASSGVHPVRSDASPEHGETSKPRSEGDHLHAHAGNEAGEWCGTCEGPDYRLVENGDGAMARCPLCHPLARAERPVA